MKTSDQTDAIAKALAAAQGAMKNAPLNAVNPHFKNRYSDLAGVRDACVPVLAKHGIAVTQATVIDDSGFRLTTRLSHESGQWMEGSYPLTLAKPQEMGSQITYARRYCLASMSGIAADEDEDGQIATNTGGQFVTHEQVKTLQALIVDADANIPGFLKAMAVGRLEEIPATRFDDAVGKLKSKIQRQQKEAA